MRRIILFFFSLLCLTVGAQNRAAQATVWGTIDSHIAPWAQNCSLPVAITHGLQGRHIALWQSHGYYYDQDKGRWKSQRPPLFCTTEDLFTQTLVVPYLIPMLENAGAYVFTPRERDWQVREVIVDNDHSSPGSTLLSRGVSPAALTPGFRFHEGVYRDGENPFTAGTALTMSTTESDDAALIYVPAFTEEGRYAVYVSYPYLADAVTDAHYTVCHRGIRTEFVVNQQIGYGTWVYLGTFDFAAETTPAADASTLANGVILSGWSSGKGHIGADAVRFGGGMGTVQRGGACSSLPRALEGARYYCQWAGAPYDVYAHTGGESDYNDDLNARGRMVNWLGGGSPYIPDSLGRGVPFELSLAVHSDAGYHDDGKSIYGSLAIVSTSANDGLLAAGSSRQASYTLGERLLDNLTADLTAAFGTWTKRQVLNKNYNESRVPGVPSAIIETLSHQSFPDMIIGEHPYGKFVIARSIYKTLLRFICAAHGQTAVVAPLPPAAFHLTLDGERLTLAWQPRTDAQEPTAAPTSYNIYTSVGGGGFDNGQNVEGTQTTIMLHPDVQYNFRITACNAGGESFPTETLAAYVAPQPQGTILVVNAFERLAAPQIIDETYAQGFDLDEDEGVQRGLYAGWCGRQIVFDKEGMGSESSTGLGYSGSERVGHFVMGNERNYACEHTRAIAYSKTYSVVSTSLQAVESYGDMTEYCLVDYAFGLQKDDGQLGIHFKTFTPERRKQIERYTKKGGALIVSGAYIGSDMSDKDERQWMKNVLKVNYRAVDLTDISDEIAGLGIKYQFYHTSNDKHYAATHTEVLSPEKDAICAMQYDNGASAAVAYRGKYACMTMGFPYECITDDKMKMRIMQGIIAYLLKESK